MISLIFALLFLITILYAAAYTTWVHFQGSINPFTPMPWTRWLIKGTAYGLYVLATVLSVIATVLILGMTFLSIWLTFSQPIVQ